MKYIESYFIKKAHSGIIELVINTTEKWIDYHEYTKGSYVIGEDDNINGCCEIYIPVDKFQFEEGMKYASTSMQNKDQIIYYYIPYNLLLESENGKYKVTSKNIIHQWSRQ